MISQMDNVYLKIFSNEESCLVPIETVVTLFVIKYCNSDVNINLVVDHYNAENKEKAYDINLSNFVYKILKASEIPVLASFCDLPNIIDPNDNSCTAGLCGILRKIIKKCLVKDPLHHCHNLLGFKYSCLLACSEASIWTKFCEVDIIGTLKFHNEKSVNNKIPVTLARFESHMSQPVKLHNLYKYTKSKKFFNDPDIMRDEHGHPEHAFAEGSTLTLSDLIIFVCIYTFLNIHCNDKIFELLPLTSKWYERLMENDRIIHGLQQLALKKNQELEMHTTYILPTVENFSLYKSDPKRYKPRNRIFTKQEDVENSLLVIKESDFEIVVGNEPFAMDEIINWEKIPYEATPKGGSLPESRLERKFQQLENLCRPVLKLAKADDIIVDFCSGSGHLGILIAYLLPQCSVILLENKEESLKIAKERVKQLELKNVRFVQCNLDYFKGDFNIGTSLHACGVATDLVIRQCILKNAAFVCCPCCYGSIQDCYHITYPRSNIFTKCINKRYYMVLGHAADQTHGADNIKTKQGYHCMAVIDTDRKLLAEQFEYTVHLGKLIPPSCTPKNNLLVGLPKSKREKNLIV